MGITCTSYHKATYHLHPTQARLLHNRKAASGEWSSIRLPTLRTAV